MAQHFGFSVSIQIFEIDVTQAAIVTFYPDPIATIACNGDRAVNGTIVTLCFLRVFSKTGRGDSRIHGKVAAIHEVLVFIKVFLAVWLRFINGFIRPQDIGLARSNRGRHDQFPFNEIIL
ncbi:hypothetical protein D3C79_669830 [compost metagenome]